MAPRRKRITKLGQHLRAARQALGVDQQTFAAMNSVSVRTLSRWENGGLSPTPDQRGRLLGACEQAPAELLTAMADVLGIALEEPAPEPVVEAMPALAPVSPPRRQIVEAVGAATPAEPVPAQLPRPSIAELRAALDAIVYAAAEERDVIPRHLRAFAVELLEGAERLGISGSEAARLVASRERTKVKLREEEGTPEGGGEVAAAGQVKTEGQGG